MNVKGKKCEQSGKSRNYQHFNKMDILSGIYQHFNKIDIFSNDYGNINKVIVWIPHLMNKR